MAEQDQRAERARIIEAAHRCLASTGGASVSVSDILAETGLGTRAFYRHFDSKDDLLLAMFRRDHDRVTAELQTAIASAQGPEDALRRYVQSRMRLVSEKRRRQRVLVLTSEEVRRARGYDAELNRAAEGAEAILALIVEQGRDSGDFPLVTDVRADARAIAAVLQRAFDEQILRPSAQSAEEASEQVIDFALRALGAPTRDTSASGGTGRRGAAVGDRRG
ncbi:TetR/AcrR family transcriptional regulator [Streptomyces sp. NBC_00445]|uniref:TetR/AcrR family transcriptional regulator n=1 Tax=Streptomyces sp. NBC_00445 TaxID=2975745 RepID=UPI002E242584